MHQFQLSLKSLSEPEKILELRKLLRVSSISVIPKNRKVQTEEVKISLEAPVPENHILRAIDFSFIYEEVKGFDKGRPGIDPVSLFKIVFIQYLFGISSMRRTIRESESSVSVVYRLFLNGACANKHKNKEVKVTKPIKQYQHKHDRSRQCFIRQHERCFAYSTQTTCDKHGFVLDFEPVARNLHDGLLLYEKMDLGGKQTVAVDAGYKLPVTG